MQNHYKQSDARWAFKQIPNTKQNIMEIGCLICSLSNLLKESGLNEIPNQVVDKCKFDENGLFVWSSFDIYKPNVAFLNEIECEDKSAPVELIDDLLKQGKYLIVKVYVGRGKNRSQHFINLWEKTENGYFISDSLNDYKYFQDCYGDPAKGICRIKIFDMFNQKDKQKQDFIKMIKTLEIEAYKI